MFEDLSSLIAEINCITIIWCFVVYFQFPGKIKKLFYSFCLLIGQHKSLCTVKKLHLKVWNKSPDNLKVRQKTEKKSGKACSRKEPRKAGLAVVVKGMTPHVSRRGVFQCARLAGLSRSAVSG